ncbi:helix-turn-helix domain-containing protein [Dysgonomonas sp.]
MQTGNGVFLDYNSRNDETRIKLLSSEKPDIISIDAIALEVGFNNRTSFYQSFKKITGLSPSDFRNNRVK